MSDGWETRRSQHERGKYAQGGPLFGVERSEWAIIKFGAGGKGVVRFVEVDTAFHPGNYPVVSGLRLPEVIKSAHADLHRRARSRLRLSRGMFPMTRRSGRRSWTRNR